MKDLLIVKAPNSPHLMFAVDKGGVVPKELDGFFTSNLAAEIALNAYNSKREERDRIELAKLEVKKNK